MKKLSDNVMSSLGFAAAGSAKGRTPSVDPLQAIGKVRESKKDAKNKAYKAALLDLLYLQVVTGKVPGISLAENAPPGLTAGTYPTSIPGQYPSAPPQMPPGMGMGQMPPGMGQPPQGMPQGMAGLMGMGG